MTQPRAADDFEAIRARMEVLRGIKLVPGAVCNVGRAVEIGPIPQTAPKLTSSDI
jgi:hypothetical protein